MTNYPFDSIIHENLKLNMESVKKMKEKDVNLNHRLLGTRVGGLPIATPKEFLEMDPDLRNNIDKLFEGVLSRTLSDVPNEIRWSTEQYDFFVQTLKEMRVTHFIKMYHYILAVTTLENEELVALATKIQSDLNLTILMEKSEREYMQQRPEYIGKVIQSLSNKLGSFEWYLKETYYNGIRAENRVQTFRLLLDDLKQDNSSYKQEIIDAYNQKIIIHLQDDKSLSEALISIIPFIINGNKESLKLMLKNINSNPADSEYHNYKNNKNYYSKNR